VGSIIDSETLKWWNYGIVDEDDLNGDGLPDYSWFGGDDGGYVMYVFLSSKTGYSRVDVVETLKAAWMRKFRSSPPEIDALGGDYAIKNVFIERSEGGLGLAVSLESHAEANQTFTFRIEPTDFKA